MRAPALVTIVVLLHVVALGAFIFIQGCGTQQGPAVVEPPPAPVMPAKRVVSRDRATPAFQPPAPVQPAPAMSELQGSSTYVIQKGDSLSKIAKRAGISTRELAELNGIANPNKIRLGQKIILPPYAKSIGSPATASKKPAARKVTKPTPRPSAGSGVYVVQAGDSLSKIAVRQGTTVKALKAANGLSNDKILIGQKLAIPGGASKPVAKKATAAVEPKPVPMPEKKAPVVPVVVPIPEPEAAPELASESVPAPGDDVFEYTVSEGETLGVIARNFAVLKEDIISLNDLTSEDLQPGQKIKIPPMAY